MRVLAHGTLTQLEKAHSAGRQVDDVSAHDWRDCKLCSSQQTGPEYMQGLSSPGMLYAWSSFSRKGKPLNRIIWSAMPPLPN